MEESGILCYQISIRIRERPHDYTRRMIPTLVIVVLVCIIAVSLTGIQSYKENIETHVKLDIGNELCRYFYKLGLSILKREDYLADTSNYTNVALFESLPKVIPYETRIHDALTKQNISESDLSSSCGGADMWVLRHDKVFLFWKTLRPLIHTILDRALTGLRPKVSLPIVHFRCADTPFVKHDQYRFQYYEYFRRALERIHSHNRHVFVMSCSFHRSDDRSRASCSAYVEHLRSYLWEIGYSSEVLCNANIVDFATLFYAPAVITTSSSFAFMAGFFGHGIYIQPSTLDDDKCSSCDDFVISNLNLPHDQVEDYHQTDRVLSQLASRK